MGILKKFWIVFDIEYYEFYLIFRTKKAAVRTEKTLWLLNRNLLPEEEEEEEEEQEEKNPPYVWKHRSSTPLGPLPKNHASSWPSVVKF